MTFAESCLSLCSDACEFNYPSLFQAFQRGVNRRPPEIGAARKLAGCHWSASQCQHPKKPNVRFSAENGVQGGEKRILCVTWGSQTVSLIRQVYCISYMCPLQCTTTGREPTPPFEILTRPNTVRYA